MAIESDARRAPTAYKPPRVSWEDFHDWVDTEHRAEWVDGEIIKVVSENLRHQLLLSLLLDLFKRQVRLQKLGLVLFSNFLMRLPHRPSGRLPDLMFVANAHMDRVRETYVDGPADLVVEIVSPDSETRDRQEKFLEYEAAKIPEYWLLDQPRHEALFYVLDGEGRYQLAPISEDGMYTSSVLPGLCVRVEWFWRSPPPDIDEALADLPF
jgi:Uma2 family endonuclease